MEARVLSFSKCYFCCKNFNKLQLNQMDDSTIDINEEEISYDDLILDVCMKRIDKSARKNFVCSECNESLLSFHFFKRDTKKYNSFQEHLQKLEILLKLEAFLDQSDFDLKLCEVNESFDQFVISVPKLREETRQDIEYEGEELIEYDCEFLIDEDVQSLKAEQDLSQHEEVSPKPEETEQRCDQCDALFKTRQSLESHIRIAHLKKLPAAIKIQENVRNYETVEESPVDEETFSELPSSIDTKAKKRKFNTINDLTVEQINWIRHEVAAGEISKGNKKTFKCTVCDCVLSTSASMTRHLRDVHILRSEKDEKYSIKTEVASSKIELVTGNGTETVWKCQRCNAQRIYKCPQSFKVHLRMTHFRATKINAKFVASCKISVVEDNKTRECWKCPECERIFRHRDSLRHHIKSQHPDIKEIESKESEPAFDGNQASQRTSLVQKEKLVNSCNECGLKFSSAFQTKPKIHNDSHEVFNTLAPHLVHHKCDSCRMMFNYESSLAQHLSVHDNLADIQTIPAEGMAQVHGATFYKVPTGDADDAVDEAVWKCGHCNVRYFEENDCLTHIMLLHTSPVTCFIDCREFSGSFGMGKYVQHMKNKHPEYFPNLTYPCGSCKQEFMTVYEKLAHQKVCGAKKFECDFCGKKFLSRYQLQGHILYERGLSGFNCEHCEKRCKTLSDLKIHRNIHSLQRPYECSLCNRAFKTPGARSTHMESHTTVDGQTCEICGQKLSNRTLYQRHMKYQHNQEFRNSQLQKNACKICNKSYLRTTHFKQHMIQYHQIFV